MRLLHTSDWHLGRSFHRVGMLAHQEAWVDHLLEVVEAEQVDLVIVAGDVYDRALPPVDAVRLADEALVRLAASRARVVLTSGNHDSAQRLGFSSRLIDAAGVHLRTDPWRVREPVVLPDRFGDVAVYGLPYLDPVLWARAWDLSEASHTAVLGAALAQVRADLAARRARDPRTRSVVVGHAFVTGGEGSDSERDISVGGVSHVPLALFDDLDYVALGHLHGRHTLSPTVRYSGSPLAYSFSEADHRKGSWLVELGPEGLASATFVDAPVPRRLARLRGTLEGLLADPRLAAHEDAWVHATLTDDVRPAQAMDRLRRRFPHALTLAFDRPAPGLGSLRARDTHARTDHETVLDFVADLRGEPASADETRLWQRAVDACCEDRDQTRDQTRAADPQDGD